MIDTVQQQVSFLAVSTTGIRRFKKVKKNQNKLMLDNIELHLIGKIYCELFSGYKHKLVEALNHRVVHTAFHSIFITKFNRNLGIIETLVTVRCQRPW